MGYNGNHQGASTGAILVTLHRPQMTTVGSQQTTISDKALNIFAELSQAMAGSLEIDQTLEAILESVERLVPSDLPEVTVWDPISQNLIPYRFVGIADVDRHLEQAPDRYMVDKGYSGFLITRRQPLLVPNVDTFREVRPANDRKQYPYNSYVGLPLQVAGELVGTLELASLTLNAFSENDLEVLRIIAGEAAVALHNAIQFQEEQKRVRELSGLASLVQDVGDLRDDQDFYGRLVEGVSHLLSVKTLGFLIYDDGERRLDAQQPFQGIPVQFIDLYHLTIPPASPAEEVWLAQEMIVTDNATEDLRLQALGMDNLAKAAGIQNTVLLPLSAVGSPLGYLQVGDKEDGQPFDADDLRLLRIIAAQVSAIIENAILIRESQERAQRAEALRRVASLTGSTATLKEILEFSLRELSRLLHADAGMIYLLEESVGELRPHKDSAYGISPELIVRLGKVGLADQAYRFTVTAMQKPWLSDKLTAEDEAAAIYLPVIEAMRLKSAMIVPLVVREQGIGELMFASRLPDHFDRSDQILVATTASQLAIAIEKATLYDQTDESLQRRVVQLLALMRISRELNTTLDWEHLLKLVYDEAIRTTQADCGTMVLFDLDKAGTALKKVAYSIGDPVPQTITKIEADVLAAGEARIIQDYQSAQGSDELPLGAPHAGVRSSLIVPIAYQEHIAGLIHLHSKTAERFDTTALEIVQSLAVQAAIALGNAQRYQEQIQRTELLNRRVETMTTLLDTSQNLQLETPMEEQLEVIAYGIQELTLFNTVLISVYDEATGNLVRVTGAGIPLDTLQDLREHTQPWKTITDTAKPEFKLSRSYYIPYDQVPFAFSQELHSVVLASIDAEQIHFENAWHPEDALIVPLLTADEQPLGLISVDQPRNGMRPDRAMIESLEVFANQAALLIEIHKRLSELSVRSDNLQSELIRERKALENSRQSLPTLLHKDLEQTIAIQRLDLRSRRIRASLDIAETINQQPTREAVLAAMGSEMLTRMDFDAVLIAEPSEGGLRLMQVFGAPAMSSNPQALLGQRNPLRQSFQAGSPLFVSSLEENEEWRTSPLLVALEAKGFVTLPVLGQEQTDEKRVDAVVLATSSAPIAYMTAEDEHIFDLMTRQVAVALRNLQLFKETNRRLQEVNLLLEFSRQLGTLDTKSILRTLVESSLKILPGAYGAMVALWVPHQEVLEPQFATGYVDSEKIMQIPYRSGEALPGQAFENGQVLRVDEVNFARDYNLSSEHLLLYRDGTRGSLPVSTLVVPIMALDARLGVLVLENFKSLAAFTPEDQALVASLARQTALTLENARLYQASEERTAQLQALTRVAGTMTSSLQTNELISTLLDQLATVVPFNTGTLWLRQANKLTVQAARGFADSEERVGLSVALEDSLLMKEMITTGQPLSVGDVRADERFPVLIEHQYLSWLAVPLLSKGEVIGLLVLEKTEANYYSPAHIQALITFAGQAAVALENATLYEDSVRRAMELDQRSQRLALLNRFSTALSGSLDLANILTITTQELLRAMNCSVVSIVTFAGPSKPVLQAEAPSVFGPPPKELPTNPVFERLHETLGLFSCEDVFHEKDLEPLADFLEARSTRSLLILPLVVGNSLTGLVLVQTSFPYRFTTDEVELARTVTNQAAVALQNARLFVETERLFAETEKRSAELATLFNFGVSVTQVLDQPRLLDVTFENVARLIPSDSVMIVLADAGGELLVHRVDFGERMPSFNASRSGQSFSEHILENNAPLLVADTHDPSRPAQGSAGGIACRCWLGVPLIVRGIPTGVLSVQSETPGMFGDAEVRLLGQIANQLSVALDNAALFTTVQNHAADQEQVVKERTEQLAREHQRLQTLLTIITELSASLDLDSVLTRTLSVINDTISAKHSSILLLQPDGRSLFLRASLGYPTNVPKGGQVSTLKANEGLAGWVIARRKPALVNDLLEDERWVKRTDLSSQNRSALTVPLLVGEEILGVLMFYHTEVAHFSEDQLDLIQAVAKQIAIAINNAQLYNLIRDQAERLGDMLRTQHVETSRSQAILEAVADGVLVTDARRQITLFNASAERILGLSREQVLGSSLENFTGLFGAAAQQWVQTIRTWSEESGVNKSGDLYAERIELDNRRVVAVHLSSVRLRNDFLGTVSIFRDITHEVEVDRLKSEFVATVSHELRTPMTSIKGYVDIMLMGATGQLTEQQGHFLQIVKQNTERLAILVNDLLDVSRIEAGKITLSLQALDLNEVADNVLATFTQRMKDEDRPITLEKDIAAKLPLVLGDRDRVLQILDNLVENAYQYTPVDGKVVVRARKVDGMVQVDVVDNGIGIKQEDQPRVFERFYRGEDPLVMATSGNGLGLPIVQRLVELHNGKIWFESAGVRGEGSTFSFNLPVYEEESSQ